MHPLYQHADTLTHEVIGAAIEVHRIKGPGLLESIYEKCLQRELELRGLRCSSQEQVTIEYKGFQFRETLRLDLIVEDCLLLELKSVDALLPVHKAQVISYLKLLDLPLGLLINFNKTTLKDGIFRLMLPNSNLPGRPAEY